jgi:hypothetical protein
MFFSSSYTAHVHSRPLINRRFLLLGLAFLGISGGRSLAQRPAPSSEEMLAAAVGVLAREKSAAEQYAVILATVGKTDPAKYVRGIQLYADAKAEFDAMIAELKFDLTTGQDPAHSAVLTGALREAAEKRVAFTTFVSREVVPKVKGGTTRLPDVLSVVPELVKAITDAGLSIWKAFHDAGKERRDAILTEVDHLQWRSFADLAKGDGTGRP